MRFTQPLSRAAEALFEYSEAVPVIDTHEHIPGSEAAYNEREIRFGNLFNPYVSNDLNSAGMVFPREAWAAFHCIGDDYVLFIEKVWGHLLMARENVAIALGDRVDRNLTDLDEAKQVLRAWFYDNPKGFYGL